MSFEWTQKWKKVLIWFSGYFSLIAYAIVGGYVIVKSEDKELKKTAKIALVVSLIWAAVSAFLTIFYSCLSMSSGVAYNGAYDAYVIMRAVFDILKIVTYAVIILITLFKKEENNEKVVVEEKNETTEG